MNYFRRNEFILGFLLATALWAACLLLPNSHKQRPQVNTPQDSSKSVGGQTNSKNSPSSPIDFVSQQHQHEGANHTFEMYGVKPGEILLFLATLGLWYATAKLVRGAKNTAERQLRAYVNLTEGSVTPIDINEAGTQFTNLGIALNFKNGGATPAYDLRWQVHAQIQRIGVANAFDFLNDIGFNAGGIIGPGSLITTSQTITPSPDEFDALKQRKSAVYVGVRIEYRDAFGKSRYVIARCISREHHPKSGVLALGPFAEGNEAN